MKITVLGAGAWGTALSRLLQHADHDVTLWGYDHQALKDIRQTGRNDRYLPGIELPNEVVLESDMTRAVAGSECVVIAVPSKGFREVAKGLGRYDGLIVSVTKGIEYETGLTMCGILAKLIPHESARKRRIDRALLFPGQWAGPGPGRFNAFGFPGG